MSNPNHPVRLFLTIEQDCPYLEGMNACNLIVDPSIKVGISLFSKLTRSGFRRSGNMIYRPHCPNCNACLSVRVPVVEFKPNRVQRRILKRNKDIEVIPTAPLFDEDHYRLYQKYQQHRHSSSNMADTDPDGYLDFLKTNHTDTQFYLMYRHQQLQAVAVTDILKDGLSAVYTFYDPDMASYSPGVFAILWQIQAAAEAGLDYLYLGYWIENSNKMAYKSNFKPFEIYQNNRWCRP